MRKSRSQFIPPSAGCARPPASSAGPAIPRSWNGSHSTRWRSYDVCPPAVRGRRGLFLDANIFVYHFGPHATFTLACTDLLERVGRQELQGYTCARVLSDVAHRLMTLEAITALNRPAAGIGSYLKKHPAAV